MSAPLLLDVSPLLHRAYYLEESQAQQDGRSPMPGARLVAMLDGLIRRFDLAPGAPVAAVFDSWPTWRHDEYPPYKAKRAPKPDELRDFLRTARRILEVHGFPAVKVQGFEADDVICSLAHRTDDAIVVSGDKDFFQFLGVRGCRMWDPLLDDGVGGRGDWVTALGVWKKFGIDLRTEPASKIVEIQALMGDPTDGIPGAHGIGQKTAIRLVQEFGTADRAVRAARADALPKDLRRWTAKLVAGAEDVRMSHRLATLRPDLDVECGRMGEPDGAALAELVRGWGATEARAA